MKKIFVVIAGLAGCIIGVIFLNIFIFEKNHNYMTGMASDDNIIQGGSNGDDTAKKASKSKEEWKKSLTPEQYKITCEGGTEPAFTGKYWNHHEKGMYKCVRCGNPLFTSDTKFDSGSGWPSYTSPATDSSVSTKEDKSYGMLRTEVICKHCGAHLGHIFDDGPKPTGMRYCINSGALEFGKKEEK